MENESVISKLGESIGSGIVKHLVTLLVAGGLFGSITINEKHRVHNEIWNETGDHFQDLVKQVQSQQQSINVLSNLCIEQDMKLNDLHILYRDTLNNILTK